MPEKKQENVLRKAQIRTGEVIMHARHSTELNRSIYPLNHRSFKGPHHSVTKWLTHSNEDLVRVSFVLRNTTCHASSQRWTVFDKLCGLGMCREEWNTHVTEAAASDCRASLNEHSSVEYLNERSDRKQAGLVGLEETCSTDNVAFFGDRLTSVTRSVRAAFPRPFLRVDVLANRFRREGSSDDQGVNLESVRLRRSFPGAWSRKDQSESIHGKDAISSSGITDIAVVPGVARKKTGHSGDHVSSNSKFLHYAGPLGKLESTGST